MTQRSNEQNFQLAIQKMAAKYQAIVTMISELQDNLNLLIQTGCALLREKDAKIMELQAPVKEKVPDGKKTKA